MAGDGLGVIRRRTTRVVLDVGLLVGFIAEFVTREGPDYNLHSWIGVVLIPLIGIHLVTNWRWVTSTFRRRSAHPEWPLARFNAVFSVITAVCIVSGFPLWLEWTSGDAWVVVHNLTGLVSIVLALSHLWRNRHRLSVLLRRKGAAAAA